MELPVELQDIFDTFLKKTTISSWSIFRNNGLMTLNVRFNNYGDSHEVQECKYRNVSDKQQQRNTERAKEYKSKIIQKDNITDIMQTRSKSQKSKETLEDKESMRKYSPSSCISSQMNVHIQSQDQVTPIKHDISLNSTPTSDVTLSPIHSDVEEALPERPEHIVTPTATVTPEPLPVPSPPELDVHSDCESDSSEVSLPPEKILREMNGFERAVEVAPDGNRNGLCVYAESKPKRRHFRSHYNQKLCSCHSCEKVLVCYACTKTHDKQRKATSRCKLRDVPLYYGQKW